MQHGAAGGGGGRAAPRPSVTLEAFTMLQLYIGVSGVYSVTDALRCFVKPEELDSYKVRALTSASSTLYTMTRFAAHKPEELDSYNM